MTSTRERQQRAAARARLAREMAERQAAARKRRQRTIIIGSAVALLLVVAGTVGIVAAVGGDEDSTTPLAEPTSGPTSEPTTPGLCQWIPVDPSNPGFAELTDVGTPPPVEQAPEGTGTMTIETNRGPITVEMDLAAVPCTSASFAYLGEQGFYEGSSCHRMTDEGIFVLQCGDPNGTGTGGPLYKLAEENLPVEQSPPYPKGVVAMAKTQQPSTTGSQFFIVYEDTDLPAEYTVLGTVTEGMDIVEEIVAGGHDASRSPGDGVPNEQLVIESLQVTQPEAEQPQDEPAEDDEATE